MFSFRKLLVGLVILGALSCTEPEVVIPPFEAPTTGKKVLIEELTGVRCPNCPSAAARLEAIQQIYGDNVITINIHGNLLTQPLDESRYDFRNPDASALEESFKPFVGKPSVVINRKTFPSFSLMANPLQDQWQPIVEEELQLPQRVSLLHDLSIIHDGWEISIAIAPLVDIPGVHRLHVVLAENGIVDAQEDVDRIIPDYIHDHVLRKSITGINGQKIANQLEKDSIIQEVIYIDRTDIDPTWQVSQMEVIYFITNAEGEVEEVENLYLGD